MLIEDYGLIGDLQTAALVGRNGSIDWLCFPRFDSGACFAALLGDESNGRWLLAPDCKVERVERRYREHSLVHELDFHTEHGSVRVTDFMPPRGQAPDVVRIVEGLEGSVPMRMELVIRFDYGSIVPWVRRLEDDTRIAVAGPDAVAFRTPVDVRGENLSTVADFTADPGERIPFVLTWFPSHLDPPRAITPDHALRRHVRVLGRVARHLHVRRPLRRGRLPLADGAEGDDVCPDWRHRGRADDLASGADRRRAELGLPVLLAPRRQLRALRARRQRLRRGSRLLAGLAPARRRRRPGGHPDHVRPRRRAATARIRAAVARRLRGLEARPSRQRREHAVPARRLRRGRGRSLRGASARAAGRRQRLGAAPPPASRASRPAGRSPTRGSGRCAGQDAISLTRR